MKHFFVSILLALMPICGLWAEVREITVGSGTTQTNTSPFCNYYNHGANQIVYAGKELNASGKISAIAFDVATASEYTPTSIKIYMGHKASGAFADNADFVPLTDLTLVYSGAPTLGKEVGWEKYVLDKPFDFDGSNLVVAIEKHANNYVGALTYNATNVTGSVLYRQNDNNSKYGDFDQSIAYSVSSTRPNIRLTIDVQITTHNGIEYILSGGKAVVVGITSALSSVVNIPASISYGGKSYPVVSIASSIFRDNTTITSVSLPNSIGSFDSHMFDGCTSLTSVTLPSSLKEIPDYAFYGCTSLQSISIPSSVTLIGEYAFYGCSAITSLTIPANVSKLGKLCFWNLSALKELTIEDSSEVLHLNNGYGYYGMFRNSPISKLYLGRDLEYYDDYYASPFYNQTAPIEVTIGPQVTELGNYLFYSGTGLKSITIPANVQSIGKEAFYGCTNLAKVINGSALTITPGSEENGNVGQYAQIVINGESFGQVGDFLYYVSGGVKTLYEYIGTKTEVVTPQGYQVEDNLFKRREDLVSITFSKGVKRISRACMEECTGLTSVVLPSSIEEIDDYAFYRCTSLISIALPSGLKRLGAHALQHCSALTTVSIPEGITVLEDFCLSRCSALESVSIPSTVTRIEAGVFSWDKLLTQVSLPDRLEYLGPFAFKYCTTLSSVNVPASIDSIALHTFYYCPKLTHVELPEGITSIGDFAFYNSGLMQITLPGTLKRIGQYALAQNKFMNIELPASLSQLEAGALSGNTNLQDVTIPDGITELSERVLYNCRNLKTLTLPSAMTRIGKMALSYTPVHRITWPKHLTSIGYQALGGNSQDGSNVIPGGLTDIDCMLFYGRPDGTSYYCYHESMLPDNVFLGQTVSASTLYVLPGLVDQYKASELGKRFKAIKPLGDTNGDGELSIADVVSEIDYLNTSSKISANYAILGNHDINGDGLLGSQDVADLGQMILEPAGASEAATLTSSATITPDNLITEPSSGCELLIVRTSFESEAATSLDLVNQLRWEACLEGIWSPSNTGRHLSMDDYHTYGWSTALERIARVRALEARYAYPHQRLTGGSCFTVRADGQSSSSESLAFGSGYLGQIMAYYAEKDIWSSKDFTFNKTGHYTAMVNPRYYSAGMANSGSVSTHQFSSAKTSGESARMLEDTGYQTFYLEVKSEYITDYVWYAKVGSKTIFDNFELKDDETLTLWYAAKMEYRYNGSIYDTDYFEAPGTTYSSSNPAVATVDPETGQVRGISAGTATITATRNGVSSSTTVTVTCNHEIDKYSDPVDNKASGICKKCGEEFEYELPASFSITFWRRGSGSISWGSSSPESSYTVGSTIEVSYSFTGGSTPFNYIIIENDHPELISVPYNAETSTMWPVLGAGDVKLKAYLKYNPKIYRTYTLHLVDPEQ